MNNLALKIVGETGEFKAVELNEQLTPVPIPIPMGGIGTLGTIIRNGITIFIIIALVLAIIILIWAAIDWLSSGGDKQKVAAARMKVTYAVIGLVVVFLAFFIVNFIGFLFRVPLTG